MPRAYRKGDESRNDRVQCRATREEKQMLVELTKAYDFSSQADLIFTAVRHFDETSLKFMDHGASQE